MSRSRSVSLKLNVSITTPLASSVQPAGNVALPGRSGELPTECALGKAGVGGCYLNWRRFALKLSLIYKMVGAAITSFLPSYSVQG